MGRPPRPIQRINVTVRFEPSEMASIDKARGEITRQEWIHGLALGLSRHIGKAETGNSKPARAEAPRGEAIGKHEP